MARLADASHKQAMEVPAMSDDMSHPAWSHHLDELDELNLVVHSLQQQRITAKATDKQAACAAVKEVANALQKLGIKVIRSGMIDRGEDAFAQLLTLANEEKNASWAGVAHGNLGAVSLLLEEFEPAGNTSRRKWR